MKMVEKLEAAIRAKGLTQSSFERAAMLSENRISKWKNNQGEPTASQALRMARMLGVSVEYLIDDEVDAPEPSVSEWERKVWEVVQEIGAELAWKKLVRPEHVASEPRLLPPPPKPKINREKTG
jgi:transcriptional regulator with XRE-family HTH domain